MDRNTGSMLNLLYIFPPAYFIVANKEEGRFEKEVESHVCRRSWS